MATIDTRDEFTAVQDCSLVVSSNFDIESYGGRVELDVDDGVKIICSGITTSLENDKAAGFLYGTNTDGDFVLIAKLTGTDADANTERSGLVYWIDSDNYIYFSRGRISSEQRINLTTRIGGTTTYSNNEAATWTEKYMKLQRSGNVFSAWYSTDGNSWTQTGSNRTVALGTAGQAGVYAETNNANGDFTSTWDEFNLDGTDIPLCEVRAGYSSFEDNDTATGIDDWTEDAGSGSITHDTTNGNVDIQSANTSYFPGGSMASMANLRYDQVTDGDFVAVTNIVSFPGSGNSDCYAGIIYRIDDSNFIWAGCYRSASRPGKFRVGLWKTTSGTYDGQQYADPDDDGGDILLKLTRSTNDFTASISSDGGSTWTTTAAHTEAYGTGGNLCLISDKLAAQGTITYDNFRVTSGVAGTAKFLCGDNGSGTGRYIDFGTEGPDYSTFEESSTNLTLTWDVAESDDYNDFDGSTWDATGLTTAQLQARSDSGKRYLQIQANATASGSDPSLESISLGSASPAGSPWYYYAQQ